MSPYIIFLAVSCRKTSLLIEVSSSSLRKCFIIHCHIEWMVLHRSLASCFFYFFFFAFLLLTTFSCIYILLTFWNSYFAISIHLRFLWQTTSIIYYNTFLWFYCLRFVAQILCCLSFNWKLALFSSFSFSPLSRNSCNLFYAFVIKTESSPYKKCNTISKNTTDHKQLWKFHVRIK